jgi:hypothetical protein
VFNGCRNLLNSLIKIGASEHRSLYNAKLEQIQTSIRYCEFFEANSSDKAKNLDLDNMDDILRAKIDVCVSLHSAFSYRM